jgi:GMP synthase (glutamine-hydrolysing)
MDSKILILDFGSQYTQLIARRVRELNVFCEIYAYDKIPEDLSSVVGVVLSGSPFSVRAENKLVPDLSPIIGKIPLLGICYGAQWLADQYGGRVEASETREYGKALFSPSASSALTQGIGKGSQVWMSHGDTIFDLGPHFETIGSTEDVRIAAFASTKGSFDAPVFGIQFHPEVTHSKEGLNILSNFVFGVCNASNNWTPDLYIESTVEDLKVSLGDDKVILGLSGGVDSTVAALLLHKAIGYNLYCIFVDNGLLRKNEFEEVLSSYENMGLQVKGVDASDLFISALHGISDPEQKRKIIGAKFIDVFAKEAQSFDDAKWLGQGTIYPDVIESLSVKGPSVTIKSHHNVGGLPEKLDLKIVEPLRMLFKDEVRKVGRALGIQESIIGRHPFPGPGLAIRCLGEINEERLSILKEADKIYIDALKKAGLYSEIWQAGAILLPIQSVGVMGDERTYEQVLALRAVESVDGMTAEWCKLPYDFLAMISSRIINQVKGVNRVVYDISTKPPATIEWE